MKLADLSPARQDIKSSKLPVWISSNLLNLISSKVVNCLFESNWLIFRHIKTSPSKWGERSLSNVKLSIFLLIELEIHHPYIPSPQYTKDRAHSSPLSLPLFLHLSPLWNGRDRNLAVSFAKGCSKLFLSPLKVGPRGARSVSRYTCFNDSTIQWLPHCIPMCPCGGYRGNGYDSEHYGFWEQEACKRAVQSGSHPESNLGG